MALPNFLCVGTQKAGTTTIYDIIKQHPNIYLPSLKEIHFFNNDESYNKGILWYKEFFSNYQGEKAIGEITPAYMYIDYVPERILRDLGKDIKLIFILRNPADRAYSQYVMNCMKGYENKIFEDALRLEDQRIQEGFIEKLHMSYRDRGYYATQIKRYLRLFPRENMLFLFFEDDLINNKKQMICKILKFLRVENIELDLEQWSYPSKPVSNLRFKTLEKLIDRLGNTRKKIKDTRIEQAIKWVLLQKVHKNIDLETKHTLIRDYFIDDIKELEKITGKKLKCWYS